MHFFLTRKALTTCSGDGIDVPVSITYSREKRDSEICPKQEKRKLKDVVSGTWRWSQNTDGHNEVTKTQTLLFKRVVSGQLHGQRLISKHAITVSGKFVGESGFPLS